MADDLEQQILEAPHGGDVTNLVLSADVLDARAMVALAMRPGRDFENVMERFGNDHAVDRASFRLIALSARYADDDGPVETLLWACRRAEEWLRDVDGDVEATVRSLAPEIDPRWKVDAADGHLGFEGFKEPDVDGIALRDMRPADIWNVVRRL